MLKKLGILILVFCLILLSFASTSSSTIAGELEEGNITLEYRNVTIYAPAVASTEDGYIGVLSTITVTIQTNGSGRVFVDTLPLTQIDMQGSARLAVTVASTIVDNDRSCNISSSSYDYFFVVRTSAPIIGGPSAGAIMTLATISLLEGWDIDNRTVMTGTINPDGSVGPVGGIIQKIDAAASAGATRFLIPAGQGTYTEMVTKRVVENGWTRIVSQPVVYQVSDYAMDNYGIEVVEVADIHDVILFATGNSFDMPEVMGEIFSDNYTKAMQPLANSLLNEARNLYQNASSQLNITSISNIYPFFYRNEITDIFNEADFGLQESQKWYDSGRYYSSTSYSFQSLINSRFVKYACGYFNSDDKNAYILSLFDEAYSLHDANSDRAKNADIEGIVDLQCVGAAQQRSSESESYLEDGQDDFDNGDYLTALYKISFAMERSNSVGWWMNISSYYNDTTEVDSSQIYSLAGEYIEETQQAVIYAGVLLQEMGRTSGYITAAEELLETARDNYEKGFPAAALFEVFEALVKANLALEISDGVTEDKIDRAQENARVSMSESILIGIEPVLAVSYYEYAESLANESSYDNAIVYYKLSDIIAGALGFTSTSCVQSSRYVGIPERQVSDWSFSFGNMFYFILFLLIGGLGGLGLGLIIGSIAAGKEQDKNNEWSPRNIDDYYKNN